MCIRDRGEKGQEGQKERLLRQEALQQHLGERAMIAHPVRGTVHVLAAASSTPSNPSPLTACGMKGPWPGDPIDLDYAQVVDEEWGPKLQNLRNEYSAIRERTYNASVELGNGCVRLLNSPSIHLPSK